MSDPYFTALLLIATYGYVRGLRCDRPDRAALLFGADGRGLRVSRPPTGRIDTRGGHCCPVRAAPTSPGSRKSALGPADRGPPGHRDRWLLPLACVHSRRAPRADIIHALGGQRGLGAEFASHRPHDVYRSDVYRAVHPAGCLRRAERGEPHRPGALAMGLVHRARAGRSCCWRV